MLLSSRTENKAKYTLSTSVRIWPTDRAKSRDAQGVRTRASSGCPCSEDAQKRVAQYMLRGAQKRVAVYVREEHFLHYIKWQEKQSGVKGDLGLSPHRSLFHLQRNNKYSLKIRPGLRYQPTQNPPTTKAEAIQLQVTLQIKRLRL